MLKVKFIIHLFDINFMFVFLKPITGRINKHQILKNSGQIKYERNNYHTSLGHPN
jgi:hypothetical protein